MGRWAPHPRAPWPLGRVQAVTSSDFQPRVPKLPVQLGTPNPSSEGGRKPASSWQGSAGQERRPFRYAQVAQRRTLTDATTSPSRAVRLGGRAESERVWESSERGGAGRKDPARSPEPAGLGRAAAGVQGPQHRSGCALGGRAAARAGLAKRPGDQDHLGTAPGETAVPSGSRVPQNDPGVPLAKGRHGPPPPGRWCLGRPAPAPLKEARP
jgi:hypothetical protein